MMYALLKDGMVIKEGDEYYYEKTGGWVKSSRSMFWDRFYEYNDYPIRRKLSTLEEMQEFYKECEE